MLTSAIVIAAIVMFVLFARYFTGKRTHLQQAEIGALYDEIRALETRYVRNMHL